MDTSQYTSENNWGWNPLFNNINKQGRKFSSPISSNGLYYAFLSKADYDESIDSWSVMFEVLPAKWAINVFTNGSRRVKYKAPLGPDSMYHIPYVKTEPLLNVLGLIDPDDIAEGTWYLILIRPQDMGKIQGILYNPDIDVNPDNPNMFYGNYQLDSATLSVELIRDVYLPDNPMPRQPTKKRPRDWELEEDLAIRYAPYGRKQSFRRIAVHPNARMAVAPPITSIGAMDVGQGNCNLLIDSNNEPFTYFDLGYPLWFYVGSLPANLNYANLGAAYRGPITQNAGNDLEVVLSHWDWDHWRLGKVANMNTLRWIVPNQTIGASALKFFNTLTNCYIYNGGPFNGAGGTYTLHRCNAAGLPAAAILNNSGLAMNVNMQLPTTSAVATTVLMTGDANFPSIQGGPFLQLSGIEAVHHGSNAHGASNNLPNQIANYNGNGRIFYSYGLRISGGALVYVYGFPVPAAITNYHNAGWTVESGTAEGDQIRALPTTQANRGNVRVGNPALLPVAYNNTAFYNFPNTVN